MPTMTPATRLIDAMMADEAILGRLVGYDAKIANFRKVLNDETVADELRLADVSTMLDLPEADLVALANGSSFRRGAGPAGATTRQPEPTNEDCVGPVLRTLDLRPLFDAGMEPLATILQELPAIEPGGVLVIEAPFHPLPLRRLLRRRGFRSSAECLGAEHWRVRFERSAGGPRAAENDGAASGCGCGQAS